MIGRWTLTDRMRLDGPPYADTFPVQPDVGFLRRAQRRWAWVVFMALAGYAPVVAYALRVPFSTYTIPSDTWVLSVTVAALVGVVIVVDDAIRRRIVGRRP